MKRMIVSMFMIVIIAGTFVLSAPPAKAEAGVPTWTKGDYWEFETVGISPRHLDLISEKLRIDVEERTAVEAEGVSVDSYRCTVTMTITALFMSTTMTGDVHIRAFDLAYIKGRWSSMGDSSMATYTPPLEQFRFPLNPGQTWKSSSVVTTQRDDRTETTSEVHTYSVAGPRAVSVHAGAFESFMITDDGGFNHTGAIYYSERAGYVVKTTGNGWGPMFGEELELKSYRYQNEKTLAILVGAFLGISAAFMLVFMVIAIRRTYRTRKVQSSPTTELSGPKIPPKNHHYPPPMGP